MVCISVYYIYSMCVRVHLMTAAKLLFVNSDKAGVSAAYYVLALLDCLQTHTHTGDNQPFPLPQHDTVCMNVSVCVELALPLHVTDGLPQ